LCGRHEGGATVRWNDTTQDCKSVARSRNYFLPFVSGREPVPGAVGGVLNAGLCFAESRRVKIDDDGDDQSRFLLSPSLPAHPQVVDCRNGGTVCR
jgi:hypothetical protein